MKEDKYQDKIADYLNGNLTVKEAEELRRILEEEGYDLSRLDEMEHLAKQMDEIVVPEPREEMRDQFYRMLENEKARLATNQRFIDTLFKPFRFLTIPGYLPRVAYACLILIIGIAVGHWIIPERQAPSQTALMMEEIQGMKQMMALTLFEQSSASDRLKAVSFTSELSQPDIKIYEALLRTLNGDPSVNVRLASLEALISHIEVPEVRIGLVRSINNQDSPLVQMAIAELMIKTEEIRAVPEIQRLLQREDLNETVAKKLKESIAVLI